MPKPSPDRAPVRARRSAPAATTGAIPLRPDDAPREREEPRDTSPPGADEQLASLLQEFGGAGYRVRLDRKDVRGELEYLGTVELTPELLDDVRARFGGGRYRGRVVTDRGGYVRSLLFGIAGAPRDPDGAQPEPRATASDDRLERLERTLAQLAERLASPPAADPLAQFVTFAKVMRELSPPAAAPASAASSDPLESLTRLLTFQTALEERIGPRGSAAPGLDVNALVREGVKPLAEVLNRKIDLEREAMLRRGGRPVAVVERERVGEVPATVPASPLAALVQQLPSFARAYLASCARDDKSAELYAETVLDALPGDVVDALPELLAGDDVGARLCAAVPEWAGYDRWFGELAAALMASLSPVVDDLEATG